MALELSTELDSGITGNYWRIGSVVVACTSNPVVTVYMELYVNRTARFNGKTPLITRPVNMSLIDIDPTYDYDFRACVYNALKQFEPWNNSKMYFEFEEKYDTAPICNFIDVEAPYCGNVVLPAFTGSDLNNLPLTFEIVEQPANGYILVDNDTYTYTPNVDWSGSDTATYRCFNGTEYSKPATIYLTVVSLAPTANNIDVVGGYETSTVLNLSATDPNNLPLTFEIVSQPSNGTITELNGEFSYLPNQGWSGTDSATYKAYNGNFYSNTATINLSVESAVPTAFDINTGCEMNGSVVLGLNANDPNNLPLAFTIVSQPQNGNIVEDNGVFTYFPSTDFEGQDTATYQANNGNYDSNLANITITVTPV